MSVRVIDDTCFLLYTNLLWINILFKNLVIDFFNLEEKKCSRF